MNHSLATGHDRLLELGAPPASQSDELLEAIETADGDARFEKFTLRLFDHLGLDVSDLSDRAFVFKHGQRQSDAFADVPEEGMSVTFDRLTSLSREDLAISNLRSSGFPRCAESAARWKLRKCSSFANLSTGKGQSVLLECAFIVEVIAPSRLHLDRFLPPTLLRVIVDHNGTAQTKPHRLPFYNPATHGVSFLKRVSAEIFSRKC